MPRPSSRDATRQKVRNYLAIAEGNLPSEYPLTILSVAAALGISRTTIYKYGLDKEINTAAKRQQENSHITGKAEERRAYADRLRDRLMALGDLEGAQQAELLPEHLGGGQLRDIAQRGAVKHQPPAGRRHVEQRPERRAGRAVDNDIERPAGPLREGTAPVVGFIIDAAAQAQRR